MAKIISAKDGEEIEVKDNSKIQKPCEKLGIPFQCKDGICGTCMIDIIEGKENLSELTEEEEDLDRDREHRLACQCKIKEGSIKVDF